MSIATRLTKLESRIVPHCLKCGHPFRCDWCAYGFDVQAASNEQLERIILGGVRDLLGRHGIGFFGLIGCELNRLDVGELRTLRALLDKMDTDCPATEAA
jgi:hypothetical protein